MCFSPTASFGASAVLLTIGLISQKKAQTGAQHIFAGVPLIFAVQQFFEGILWLALMHTAYAQWEGLATYAFLIFAQVVWPVYVPLAIMLLEKEPVRRKILSYLLSIGILLAGYLAYCLKAYNVSAAIDGHHIRYSLDFPGANRWYSGIFYFIPTAISPFISGIKRIRWLGAVIVLSYLITRIFYQYYVISVWCYFAAIISLIVLAVIIKLATELESKNNKAFK